MGCADREWNGENLDGMRGLWVGCGDPGGMEGPWVG